MSQAVTLYNLFIASPSDVAWARAQVRQTVNAWNEIHAKHSAAVLLPVGWERSSAPNMGRPAQELINEKLLSDADILVGVFWTKLGTPTTEYDSGTVEEIERHILAGKPTLLYFSGEPVALDSVDREDYERLVTFKKSCRDRGQYHTFDTASQFADDFNRHLAMHMNDLIGTSASPVGGTKIFSNDELSDSAKILLAEAAKDTQGSVFVIRHLGGTAIQTNGRNMTASNERREIARWEGAVDQLVRLELLVGRDTKGEVFEVTTLGYEVADSF
ncbi:hypothetical protein IV02_08210 [Pseudomonas syringae]|uniref:DUF4062 domain-containing protein n=2 Tax=Pseudomonas syringae TaxID=317 RepID=A0A085VAE6_PSESX|nr:hypothetical protein IV02_08210 [Pseudomonas syringae]